MSYRALMVPKDLVEYFSTGGYEVIENKTENGVSYYLHILEASERARATDETTELYQHAQRKQLDSLKWAQETLLEHQELRQFFVSSDPLLWPEAERLREAVGLLCTTLRLTNRFSEAINLEKALDILETERKVTGMHPLKEVSNDWKAFRSGETPGELQRSSVPLQSTFFLEFNTRIFDYFEVIGRPLPDRLLKQLLPHLESSSPSSSTSEAWKRLLECHKANLLEGNLGIFYNIADYTRTRYCTEEDLVMLLERALGEGKRIRIQSGVFISIILWPAICFLVSQTDTLSDEEKNIAEQFAESFVGPAKPIVVVKKDKKESNVSFSRRLFLGPLHDDQTLSVKEENLSSSLSAVTLKVEQNRFGIVHGVRVSGGFQGSESGMSQLKRMRDRSTRESEVAAKTKLILKDQVPHSAEHSRPVERGGPQREAEILSAVKKSCIDRLREGPLTRAELKAGLGSLATLAPFDSVLTSVLKEVAKYEQKRYHLRE